MKTCARCKKQLPETEFYKNAQKKDELMTHCKNCDRLYRRKMRKLHPETYKARDKRYYAAHKEQKSEYLINWRKTNKTKIDAHATVRQALRQGSITRQPCFCGVERTDAHHEDYSKPLEVHWLCRRHHELIHS